MQRTKINADSAAETVTVKLQTLSIFVETWRCHIAKIQISSILQLMIFAPEIPHPTFVPSQITNFSNIYKPKYKLYKLQKLLLLPICNYATNVTRSSQSWLWRV